MLKLCACNAVPGTATRESGWSSESRVSNGLGSRDSGRLGLLGKASRNRDVPRLTGQSDRLLQMKGATPRKGEPRRGSRMVPIRGNGRPCLGRTPAEPVVACSDRQQEETT